jgi:DNA-binding transcriptional LysR family regulator
MDLTTLQLFLEVVGRGSFAAVARSHDKAPSSVSRAVAALEEELGVRLFQRSTRRLQLTEAGREYFEAVEEIMASFAAAGERARSLTEQPRGTLRVTASVTFGQVGIVPLLADFMERHAELDLELLLTDTRLDLFVDRIDVAVRLGALDDNKLVTTKLCDIPYIVCASPEYLRRFGAPEKPTDLNGHDAMCLSLPEHNLWRFRDAQGKVETINIHARLRSTNVRALMQCASSAMGIALLPQWIAQGKVTSGELVPLLPGWTVGTTEFVVPVWLLYPSRQHLPLKVRVFIDYLKDCYHAKLPWN